MSDTEVEKRRAEFQRFVWNHGEDAFQARFDTRAELEESERKILTRILRLKYLKNRTTLSRVIKDEVAQNPQTLLLLIQLCGLTRNKIIQDLKAASRAKQIDISFSSPAALFKKSVGADLASEYLAAHVIRVFKPAANRIDRGLLEAVNQATWPGYIRQERAKRMGHEAEYRLACVLRDCGLSFQPEERAENPLCNDVQIDGVSYDLVAPSNARPLVLVKATVHTANIGQYGESKDHLEILEAKQTIDKNPRESRPILVALIDGVGFESNRDGLNGVLQNSDEFCQFRTLWKAACIVQRHAHDQTPCVALPEDQLGEFNEFQERHAVTIVALDGKIESSPEWEPAGDGYVRR